MKIEAGTMRGRGIRRPAKVPWTPALRRAYEKTSKARLLELLADLVALQHPDSCDDGYGGDYLAAHLTGSAEQAGR